MWLGQIISKKIFARNRQNRSHLLEIFIDSVDKLIISFAIDKP